jgi:osmoprotectant transport system substrate-binding protein
VSDLQAGAPTMVLGGPPECPTRPLCMIGYADVYGLRFRRFVPLDAGGPLTLAALQSGEIDVAVLFTGDRSVIGREVVFLADDRGLQPAENVTPVVRKDVLEASGPELRRRLDDLTALLTSADLARLVHAVDVRHEDPERAATRWLRQVGVAPTPSRR